VDEKAVSRLNASRRGRRRRVVPKAPTHAVKILQKPASQGGRWARKARSPKESTEISR